MSTQTPEWLTKALPTYFRGDPTYGRTTTLVDLRDGRTLVEVMGTATRRECYATYRQQQAQEARS